MSRNVIVCALLVATMAAMVHEGSSSSVLLGFQAAAAERLGRSASNLNGQTHSPARLPDGTSELVGKMIDEMVADPNSPPIMQPTSLDMMNTENNKVRSGRVYLLIGPYHRGARQQMNELSRNSRQRRRRPSNQKRRRRPSNQNRRRNPGGLLGSLEEDLEGDVRGATNIVGDGLKFVGEVAQIPGKLLASLGR